MNRARAVYNRQLLVRTYKLSIIKKHCFIFSHVRIRNFFQTNFVSLNAEMTQNLLESKILASAGFQRKNVKVVIGKFLKF